MGRGVVCGVLGLLLLAASVQASPTHRLKTFEARSAAESEALDYEIAHHLSSSEVGRCSRKAARRIVCLAVVKGETSTAIRACQLRIAVRAVYRNYYWDAVAGIVKQRCHDQEKPYLDYDEALAAIQTEADRFAGRGTRITYMSRRDDVTFTGRAEWERPREPTNKFDPTETCSVDLVATLGSAITVTTDGFLCY